MDFYNASLLLNNSILNDSLLGEFPYWRPVLAITLLTGTVSTVGIILIHLLVLVMLLKVKKEHFKSLNVIHMSLLISSIVEDVSRIFLNSIYTPSIVRHCVCSRIISTIIFIGIEFFIVYRPVTYACLGILQFFVILGKKRFVNLKTVSGVITLCIGIGLVFALSTTRVFYESNERAYCYESYCPDSRPESGIGVLAVVSLTLVLGSFFPSLVVVIITSTWSCTVFKKYYTGGDDQLNRRMLSLPVVMPLVVIASTLLEGVVILLIAEVFLNLLPGDYSPYWIGLSQNITLSLLVRPFTRLTYPIVLVHTHPHIREVYKKFFKRNNTVTPLPSSSYSSTD